MAPKTQYPYENLHTNRINKQIYYIYHYIYLSIGQGEAEDELQPPARLQEHQPGQQVGGPQGEAQLQGPHVRHQRGRGGPHRPEGARGIIQVGNRAKCSSECILFIIYHRILSIFCYLFEKVY